MIGKPRKSSKKYARFYAPFSIKVLLSDQSMLVFGDHLLLTLLSLRLVEDSMEESSSDVGVVHADSIVNYFVFELKGFEFLLNSIGTNMNNVQAKHLNVVDTKQ